VVFLSIFCVFAASAQILFGIDQRDFATYMRSMTTVFRIVLGDFDWNELREGGRTQANLWFVVFMGLVHIVMMNMLLAVVMDVYIEVKSSLLSGNAETLWSQSVELFVRWKQVRAGKYLPMSKILDVLEPCHMAQSPSNTGKVKFLQRFGSGFSFTTTTTAEAVWEKLTIGSFMDLVPDLCVEQARDILLSTVNEYGDTGKSEDRLPERVKKMNVRLKHVSSAVDNLISMSKMMSDLIIKVGDSVRPKRKVETAEQANDTQTPAESPSKLATALLSSHVEILLRSCVEDLTQRQSESCRRMEALVLRVVEILQSSALAANKLVAANGLHSKGDTEGSWFRGCAPAKSAQSNQIRETAGEMLRSMA